MTHLKLTCFIKAQFASAAATVVDFGITILLKEGCGLWYLFSTSAGTLVGGVTNFMLGRCWVFRVTERPKGTQAMRYILVWVGSMLLNIGGVFLLTSVWHFNYLVSKVIISLLVGVFFNYYLQKNFVFHEIGDVRKATVK